MNIRSFRITDEKLVVEIPVEEGSPAWFEDPVHRWIDIEAADGEELDAFLEPLKSDPEMLRTRVGPGSDSFFEVLENLLWIRIPVLSSDSDTELTSISLLCLPTTLVTIHREPLPAISTLALRLSGRIRLKSTTTSALIYQVILRLAGENFFAFAACRRDYDALSKQMIEDTDSIEPEALFALRRRITNIGDANEDHAFCVDGLQKVESPLFRAGDQREHFRDLDRSLDRHQRSMDRLEENIKELHQQFLLTIQDKTANRLKILTILSAVFLPLTLIAGIYGMNFENMPELGIRYAYYVVLGFMLLVGIGMLAFFYKKGWFE
jgi:magnesium transporter